MGIGPDTIVVRSQEPVAVDVDESVVMMSIEKEMYYGLDQVGRRIWQLVEEPRSVAAICTALVAEYQIEPEDCRRDVIEFLEQLATADLIRVVGPDPGAG